MDARVIFSKKTKEEMEKPLGRQAKGVILYNKLKELDESGRLSLARNKHEVARLCGYTNDKKGWNWASNMVKKGALIETVIGYLPNGKMEYEYHVGNRAPKVPNADKILEEREKLWLPKAEREAERKKETMVKAMAEDIKSSSPKITVKYGELSFEIDKNNYEFALNLIHDLIARDKE